MTNIHVHIERLILEGLPIERSQGPYIQAAIEAELTRLLAEGGLAQQLRAGGALPSIRAGVITLASGAPQQLGSQIAQSVYGGIGQGDKVTG